MAAIDQDEELDQAGTSMGKEGVESGARGASGIEDVVDQHDFLAFDGKTNLHFLDYGSLAQSGEVVAIEGDIESADGNLFLFDLLNHFAEAFGDGDAATADAH